MRVFRLCVGEKGIRSYLEKVDMGVSKFNGILCYFKWKTEGQIQRD